VGITDVHKIRMFPLSLIGAAFNWFPSLPPNSIDSWVSLEQKFYDYFYNREVELRLPDLTSLRQKYTKTVSDYLRRFRDSANKDKEKHHVNFMDEEADDEEGNEICIAEWVEKPGDKLISCSFLKTNGGWREEMRYTFDMSKCDRLFDLLLWGGVIRLNEGHVIPSADILAKKTYCK
jgi:hypothetical protein